jgi:hypothetical protein
MPQPDRALLAAYLREPRRVRRAIDLDLARAYPIPPRRPSYGRVAAIVHKRRPWPHRPSSPRSGQARINAKRNARAAYWAAATPFLAAPAA